MLHLRISGMTCDHCVAAIRGAVGAVPGAGEVSVDLERGEVAVTGNPDPNAVRRAIAAEGYEVLP